MKGEHNPVFVNGYPMPCEMNGKLPLQVFIEEKYREKNLCFESIIKEYPPYWSEPENCFIPQKVLVGFKCCLCGVEFYFSRTFDGGGNILLGLNSGGKDEKKN